MTPPTDEARALADVQIGRNLRRLAEGLPLHWRLGLMRTESGWRLVVLNPVDGDPVSFLDGDSLEVVFSDESGGVQ